MHKLILDSYDPSQRVQTVRRIRAITGCGLRDAVDMCDRASDRASGGIVGLPASAVLVKTYESAEAARADYKLLTEGGGVKAHVDADIDGPAEQSRYHVFIFADAFSWQASSSWVAEAEPSPPVLGSGAAACTVKRAAEKAGLPFGTYEAVVTFEGGADLNVARRFTVTVQQPPVPASVVTVDAA
jgi:hypothetical protein